MSLLVVGLFKFSISSYLSFGSVWVSRNLSISSGSSSLLAYNFFKALSSNCICDLFHLWFYLFAFWEVWLGVYQFCLFFQKKPALSVVDLFYFFYSISFISALIFIISLLLTFGFICCSFRCKVRLCVWDHSCFLRWAWIAMYFPLRTAFAASQRDWLSCFHFHLLPCIFKFLLQFHG